MGNSETKLQRTNSNSNFLTSPVTLIECHSGRGIRLVFGEACMQGWRSHMEDAHTMNIDLPGLEDWGLFAIFDGHAGKLASLRSAHDLAASIVMEVVPVSDSLNGIREGLRRAFLRHDLGLQSNPDVLRDHSGTTCTSVLISPTHYIFSNLGDSRAVLARGNKVIFATKDHKPSNPTERNRIKNAGGFVMNDRVDGGLAVSRAFGDFDYKMRTDLPQTKQRVSAEPETCAIPRAEGSDEFIILACDGIWDVMTNATAVKFVSSYLRQPGVTVEEVCRRLVQRCLELGSRDNMSVMIVMPDPDSVDSPRKKARSREEISRGIAEAMVYHAITNGISEAIGDPHANVAASANDPDYLTVVSPTAAKRNAAAANKDLDTITEELGSTSLNQ